MVLGCYYLTVTSIPNLLGANHYFSSLEDVILAYDQDKLELHSSIWVRYSGDTTESINSTKVQKLSDGTSIEYSDNLQIRKSAEGEKIVQYIQTTTGRVILNYTIQKTLNFL